MVNVKGSILIDDKLYNLKQWEEHGDISIFLIKII